MGPTLHLAVTVCADADDAIAKGYDYASKGNEFKPIEITEAVVVRDGTVGGNSTVDLVLKDGSGQKFVAMLTGALLKSIPC